MNKLNYILIFTIVVLLTSTVFLDSKINNLEKDKEELSKNNLILNEEKKNKRKLPSVNRRNK